MSNRNNPGGNWNNPEPVPVENLAKLRDEMKEDSVWWHRSYNTTCPACRQPTWAYSEHGRYIYAWHYTLGGTAYCVASARDVIA